MCGGLAEAGGWEIGLSVMATQASAITFLSTPGQGYASGLGFVQNYFGAPFALILISIVFLPMYRRMNVHTVYEFIGQRFDSKTRILSACLIPLAARPERRHHDLRARHRPLDGARNPAEHHDRRVQPARHRLHGERRDRCGEHHTEIPDGDHHRRHARGLWRARVPTPCRFGIRGRPRAGRRLSETQGRELLDRSAGTLHVLVGTPRRPLPGAVLLWRRPVAGPALHRWRVAARKPARPDVQQRLQDSDAVRHSAPRRAALRLLPVRAGHLCSSTPWRGSSRWQDRVETS